MKNLIKIIILPLLTTFHLSAQTNTRIDSLSNNKLKIKYTFKIDLIKSEVDSNSTLIEITKDNIPYQSFFINGEKHSVDVDFNANYFLKCSRTGYTTKVIFFNTYIPKDREKEEFSSFTVHVELIKAEDGVKKIDSVGGVLYDSKIKDFEKAGNIEYKSENIAWQQMDLGDIKAKSKDFKNAIKYYSKAIELDSTLADAYFERGNSKTDLEKYKEAISDYTICIRLEPKNADAYLARAYCKNLLKDYNGAILDYTKCIEIEPNNTNAYYTRGLLKTILNDYAGSIPDFTSAIELTPTVFEAYNERGVSKDELNDLEGAIQDFTKAIEFDPNNSEPYYNRGYSKYNLGDKEGACADWSKALDLGESTVKKIISEYCK
jgi:tetratricopeptide (TPR) repeat protein